MFCFGYAVSLVVVVPGGMQRKQIGCFEFHIKKQMESK